MRMSIPRKRGGLAASLIVLSGLLSIPLGGCIGGEDDGGGGPKAAFQPAFSATPAQVMEFLAKGGGGAKAKLVWSDRTGGAGRELCYIDFSESSAGQPIIRRIAAAVKADVPVLSPDGNWAVYASGAGTEAGSPLGARSSVYLVRLAEDAKPMLIARDSAVEPRFLQASATGRLSVLFSTLGPNLGWEGFGKTIKVEVDISGAQPVPADPEVLVNDGSYTGGLSYDGRYLSGGGGHVAMLDRQGGKGRPDTLSFDGIQSCNASASSSRVSTNTVMYLNTMGMHPDINAGKQWGEWQAILISNSAKQLVKGFMYPSAPAVPLETDPKSFTNAKWHHSEWSNHPYFAAATVNVDRFFKSGGGFVNTYFQERVYLINLRDSSYLEVLRPDKVAYAGVNGDVSGFYWPWLWVEVPAGFTENPDWLRVP